MDWRNMPAFYKTFCKTIAIISLAFRLLILTGVRTYFYVIFTKSNWQYMNHFWLKNMRGRRDATTAFRVFYH